LILPENSTLRLTKPKDNRTSAWVSLDGATRFELYQGETLEIKASEHALAFVTDPKEDIAKTWQKKLTKLLGWNVR
jgi:NAD kinase